MTNCRCGEPATNSLYLHYKYPRSTYEPLAVDPWNVQGGSPCTTCGSAACEAAVYAELLAAHPDAEVSVETEPSAGIFVVGDGAA